MLKKKTCYKDLVLSPSDLSFVDILFSWVSLVDIDFKHRFSQFLIPVWWKTLLLIAACC